MADEIRDGIENLNYLREFNFDKTLPELSKKLKGRTVIIYGAGAFFETIKKHFDLSSLNIIGISDKRFEEHKKDEEFLGYSVCSPDEINSIKPDYVLVSTKQNISIIENLYYNVIKDRSIKIMALVNKSFLTLVKEYFC